jgi:hypothetical protein
MKLPNVKAAIVEIEKLRDYCLSPVHPRGRHKVRVFLSALGMTDADADELRAARMDAVVSVDANPGTSDKYGDRYTIDFELKSGERAAQVRSCWIVRSGEVVARFVTCYIL